MTPQQLQAKMKQLVQEMEYSANEMLDIAGVARDERRKGMEASKDVDGTPFAVLDPATIKRKAGTHTTTKYKQNRDGNKFTKGGTFAKTRVKGNAANASKPLIDTGDLKEPTITATKREGRVKLAQSRSRDVSGGDSISTIHDKGSGNIPQRHHWGIYAKARTRIQAFHKARFRRICRSIFSGIR